MLLLGSRVEVQQAGTADKENDQKWFHNLLEESRENEILISRKPGTVLMSNKWQLIELFFATQFEFAWLLSIEPSVVKGPE